MITWVASLCCHLVCGGGRQGHHAGLTQAKRDLKREQIKSWKGYLKTWNCWNSQSFQGPYLWTPQRGLTAPPWTPSWKGQRADARWVMAYGYKTQSFMKNGGHERCLDKALGSKDASEIFMLSSDLSTAFLSSLRILEILLWPYIKSFLPNGSLEFL